VRLYKLLLLLVLARMLLNVVEQGIDVIISHNDCME
jgi:hypothetical protein